MASSLSKTTNKYYLKHLQRLSIWCDQLLRVRRCKLVVKNEKKKSIAGSLQFYSAYFCVQKKKKQKERGKAKIATEKKIK